MNGGVFLVQSDGTLVEMQESRYEAEITLQTLLADYPRLLAGDQINSDVPRRWLLVTREISIPGEQDGSGRWSLDHLFLDQDGVPTLVEVKRSTDTRIRREVVGQMLDYAANAVAYWPAASIQAQFEARCERNGIDAEQEIAEFLADNAETDAERFWQQVQTNLQAGRVRMVFVADQIPPELQRIIEFLNEQMSPAEVLGVVIPKYAGQGQSLYAPRVIGLTAQRRNMTSPRAIRQWDEGSFFADLEKRRGQNQAAIGRKIYDWAKRQGLSMRWGDGSDASLVVLMEASGRSISPMRLLCGSVRVRFKYLMLVPPFDSRALRCDLQARLNAIPDVNIADKLIDNSSPTINFGALTNEANLTQFLAVMDWVLDTIRTGANLPSGD